MNNMKNRKTTLYAVLLLVVATVMMIACGEQKPAAVPEFKAVSHADSLIFERGHQQDYQGMLVLIDSFEQARALSEIAANRWRGVAYNYLGSVRKSEFYYKKVVSAPIKTDADKYNYYKSSRRLSEILVKRGEYDEALSIALEAVDKMEEWGGYSPKDLAILLKTIGCCQLNLGQLKEAASNYASSCQKFMLPLADTVTVRDLNEAIMATEEIALDYINVSRFDEALHWADVADSLMTQRTELAPDYDIANLQKYGSRVTIRKAIALQGLNRDKEALQAYRKVLDSQYGKTDDGRIEAAEYLMAAHRYGEAADNYGSLDRFLARHGMDMTLDNIRIYLLPKYRANLAAGRRDSVMAVGSLLCDALDSAIVSAKNSDAAELATIYDTQQKEEQIMEQKSYMARQRLYGISLASFLILTFLIIYVVHRIRAQRRLAHAYQKLEEANLQLENANQQLEQKNEQLMVANARAEESSRMKTDFIQQISHEIRTPLNILSGYTQIVTTPGMDLDDETRQDINRQITDNTDRITGLVNKMLELSDVNSKAVIERNDSVLGVQIAAQAADDSGISNATHLQFDLQFADGADSVMLQTNLISATRALTLVLDNARKFTKPAEALGIEAAEQKHVVLRMAVNDEKLQFIVEDDGIGVPAEDADRIFDEFVQLNEYYDGTGIGLTVARSIARRLGGDIVLDTTYGPGARFVMTLPMTA